MSTNLNPLSRTGAQSEQDLGALARAFEIAQAQLDLVTELSNATSVCPNLSHDQDLYFQDFCERLSTRYLGIMLNISVAASSKSARTPAELSAKANIWLGRFVPEPDDDVLVLAESICRDLAQHA